MSIKYFETEEELHDEFERIEEINYNFLILKEELENLKQDLLEKEQELENFIENNKEYLIKL
jgi:hypothetical protein